MIIYILYIYSLLAIPYWLLLYVAFSPAQLCKCMCTSAPQNAEKTHCKARCCDLGNPRWEEKCENYAKSILPIIIDFGILTLIYLIWYIGLDL